MHPTFRIEDEPWKQLPGVAGLPSGDLVATYPLGVDGRTVVSFNEANVTVKISHDGAFKETLPLVMPDDAEVKVDANTLIVRNRDGQSFVFRTSTSTTDAGVSLADPEPLAKGLVRRILTVEASEALTYEIGSGAKWNGS